MANNDHNQTSIPTTSIYPKLKTTIFDEKISLVQMTKSFASEYFLQHRHADIQKMTDLPCFASVSEVCEWIDEDSANNNSFNYAVVLPYTGFAGFVNLIVSEHMAFFGIWLGKPFQGLGLGTQASQLICKHAIDANLLAVFTAALKNNHRSIHMLKKIGFEKLPIQAFAPYDDREFFILTKDSGIKQNGNIELVNYYQRENLPHRFSSQPLISKEKPSLD